MRLLEAATSAGDLGFAPWASAAQVTSVRVAVTIHQNSVLIIIPRVIGEVSIEFIFTRADAAGESVPNTCLFALNYFTAAAERCPWTKDAMLAPSASDCISLALQNAKCTTCKAEPFSHHANYVS
jgi:hypothetical protein